MQAKYLLYLKRLGRDNISVLQVPADLVFSDDNDVILFAKNLRMMHLDLMRESKTLTEMKKISLEDLECVIKSMHISNYSINKAKIIKPDEYPREYACMIMCHLRYCEKSICLYSENIIKGMLTLRYTPASEKIDNDFGYNNINIILNHFKMAAENKFINIALRSVHFSIIKNTFNSIKYDMKTGTYLWSAEKESNGFEAAVDNLWANVFKLYVSYNFNWEHINLDTVDSMLWSFDNKDSVKINI